MKFLRLVVVAAVALTATAAEAQKRVLVLSWNVESGDNSSNTIAKQLAAFEGFDIIGLTEVRASNAAKYTEAAGSGEGARNSDDADFQSVLSSSGGGDRMMIIWDNKRFQRVGNVTEMDKFNDGTTTHTLSTGNHRKPMFCKFRIRTTSGGPNIEFLFMVNHLARGNNQLRRKQATGLRAWAKAQTLPVIAVGDWNFDYSIDDGTGNVAFDNLMKKTADNKRIWTWVRPRRLYQTQLSPRFHSVLDFVFTANLPEKWKADSWIRTDVTPAKDDADNSDHRPLVARFLISN